MTGSTKQKELYLPLGQTAEQLRRSIDSGRTGDKIDFPDPAAAPLGTDSEAAGNTDKSDAQIAEPQLLRAPSQATSGPLIFLMILFSIIAVGIVLALQAK